MLTLKDFHALDMFLLWHGARTNTTVPGLCNAPYLALTAIKNEITLVLIIIMIIIVITIIQKNKASI